MRECLIARLPDCRIAGLPDCQIARLPDCWIAGLLDCQDCQIAGMLECLWNAEKHSIDIAARTPFIKLKIYFCKSPRTVPGNLVWSKKNVNKLTCKYMYTHYWMYIEDIYIYTQREENKLKENYKRYIYINYRRYLYIDFARQIWNAICTWSRNFTRSSSN